MPSKGKGGSLTGKGERTGKTSERKPNRPKAVEKKGKEAKPSAGSGDAPFRRNPPTHEEIERRAYEIYLSRGATHGRDLEDWLQAERELCGADRS